MNKADSDTSFVKKFRDGDISSFDALIEQHGERIFNLACRILGDEDEAKDAAQEAFIRVYNSINNFKGNSLFSTWMYRIAINVCRDCLKSKQKRVHLSDVVVYLDEKLYRVNKSVEEEVILREEKKMIEESIGTLPENYRIIISNCRYICNELSSF